MRTLGEGSGWDLRACPPSPASRIREIWNAKKTNMKFIRMEIRSAQNVGEVVSLVETCNCVLVVDLVYSLKVVVTSILTGVP